MGIGIWALGMHWALGNEHWEDLCTQVDEADEHDAAQDDLVRLRARVRVGVRARARATG